MRIMAQRVTKGFFMTSIELVHTTLIDELGKVQNKTILDYGCGRGGLIKLLLGQDNQPAFVYGVDVDAQVIEKLKSQYQEVIKKGQLVLEAISNPEQLVGKKFDKIVCHNVLECIENKELFVKNLYQLLNPKGILLVSHHDFDSAVYNSNYQDLTRSLIHDFSDTGQEWQTVCDGQIGRKIPGIVGRAGIEHFDVEIIRIMEASFEEDDYGHLMAKMLIENAKNKYDPSFLHSWMEDLKFKSQSNDFYFAIDLVIAKAYK
jgi:SAM-dependent methyltransferase